MDDEQETNRRLDSLCRVECEREHGVEVDYSIPYHILRIPRSICLARQIAYVIHSS